MTIEYIPDTVTITATVDPDDYDAGDWATVCGSQTTIDYDDDRLGGVVDLGNLGTGDPVDVTMTVAVATPGVWTFGVATYDVIGNQHNGTPGETDVYVMLTPRQPGLLAVVSYDDATSALTLK